MEDRKMEVPKQNVKDSQLQLEGLFSEDSPEGEGRKTASVSVRKNPEEGNQPTITSEEESLLTKTLDHIVSLQNMRTAFMKVAGKKGAGGVDGMKTEELTQYLQNNYSMVRQSLLEGTYKPQPVRRVEIPKDNGKTRDLGIPTVIDRGIQMAIVQVLTRIYEPKFSESSFGFRPGRSAHDALEKCIEHAREGYVWVVDMDLEKFFDTVPQSRLLQLVSETIKDGRVISLLYKYLKGGVMVDGIRQETTIGVPQGGPLSPLLSNIMLNESDRELEKRGHRFVRYADDMMILCKSERAALRVMESTTKFLEKKLKLKVNREKTVVRRITNDIKFLGYGFYSSGEVKLKVHPQSWKKLRTKLKEILNKNNGWSYEFRKMRLAYLVRGWVNYFRLANAKQRLLQLDEWIRHKIRAVILKANWRVRSRYRLFRQQGVKHEEALSVANARQGTWALSGYWKVSRWLSVDVLRAHGYLFFSDMYGKLHRVM